MFPMIENFKQYQELKKQVVKIARENGYKVPSIGMMLETQSAIINLEEFKSVEFISVGTNDLTSELFNISRDGLVLFEEYYDGLLAVLKKIIDFSKAHNIPLSVCGELISKTEFAKKAISLGLERISISPYFIKNIYKALGEEQ
jgi:phosphoenolpyruvate-protein kinase (PTS system EI component)